MDERDLVVWGTILQLRMLRLQLTEALKIGEVFTKDGERAVVRSIAWTVLGIENQLRSILPMPTEPIPKPEPEPETATMAGHPEPGVSVKDFSGSSLTSAFPNPSDIRFP